MVAKKLKTLNKIYPSDTELKQTVLVYYKNIEVGIKNYVLVGQFVTVPLAIYDSENCCSLSWQLKPVLGTS
jgi:hypothetical protein